MRDGGKGDTPRPLGVPLEKFDNNWDAIFKKKPVKTYTGGVPHRVMNSADYDYNEKNNTFTPKDKE